MTALEIFARDAHPSIRLRTRRVADLMVMAPQIVERDVHPHLDVAEESKARIRRRLGVDPRDVLDLFVIGGDPVAHQAVRRGQTVVHVDLDDHLPLFQELLGGVESSGTRADDRHTQRLGFRTRLRHPWLLAESRR